MNTQTYLYLLYGALVVLPVTIYFLRGSRKTRAAQKQLQQNVDSGLTEPASLHPVIDPNLCLGSGACVPACPEGDILGMIRHKAALINPTKCIGHGACARACPHGAITLVFGTEKRGVDIPNVKPNFETNIPGLFIAGELGGMGLIRNAIEQGRQAMDSIRKRKVKGKDYDVVIVGAGPAGFSATLGAMKHKLRYRTIEQDSLGGTVFQFPRGKLVMTQPATLPIIGKIRFRETSKEKLLDFWQQVKEKTGARFNFGERMETISPSGKGFQVKTTKGTYHTGSVLLAIGRRGTPRKLGVPGEDQPKVVYRLIDPEQYHGQHVLVVGGGDAALEAACSIAEQPGTTVTLSYRSEAFTRAKEQNRQKVDALSKSGHLKLLLPSNVKHIQAKRVDIDFDGKMVSLPNDGVIICAGGILPTPFLKELGIEVETHHGKN
ncbi:MAG: NAD(P)-binding domain-containing protein [Acidiferrobacterales bacterium]|nr:NAD(P)-binding domain-containing protein [Acidiferrobacterales bacterium]